MGQLGADPMMVAADVLGVGASALIVTLAARGAVYFGRQGGRTAGRQDDSTAAIGAIATALVPAPAIELADPTGCGDVFGAVACARVLAGDPLPEAVRVANELAAKNAGFRGASGLAAHLRGELQLR
jgi:sugar/nucleoside kinase (ribokinase family)